MKFSNHSPQNTLQQRNGLPFIVTFTSQTHLFNFLTFLVTAPQKETSKSKPINSMYLITDASASQLQFSPSTQNSGGCEVDFRCLQKAPLANSIVECSTHFPCHPPSQLTANLPVTFNSWHIRTPPHPDPTTPHTKSPTPLSLVTSLLR